MAAGAGQRGRPRGRCQGGYKGNVAEMRTERGCRDFRGCGEILRRNVYGRTCGYLGECWGHLPQGVRLECVKKGGYQR